MEKEDILSILKFINRKYNEGNPQFRHFNDKEFNELVACINHFPLTDITVDGLIELCIYLFNFQIFTDGNSRTIYEFLCDRLSILGYHIDFDMVRREHQYLRSLFPQVSFNPKNEMDKDDIDKIKKYLVNDYVKLGGNDDSCNSRTYRRW